MYKCEIIADSISNRQHRLTTFCVTYPRFIHSEFLTHGMLVRNSESSRARPVMKNIEDVRENAFIPEDFGRNQKGMQFDTTLQGLESGLAKDFWVHGADTAIWIAEELAKLDVHKSHANRILEPYKWHTAIYTATDWDNFFALRTHSDAQPEFRIIALMMQKAYLNHEPRELTSSEWHMPFVTQEEIEEEAYKYADPWIDWLSWRKVSVGRCARISYLTHDGQRDVKKDIELQYTLLDQGHMSPFGHVARPFTREENHWVERAQDSLRWQYDMYGGPKEFMERMCRNLEYCAQFRGWWQERANIPNEDNATRLIEVAK